MMKAKERKEQELWVLAQRERSERTGIAPAPVSAPPMMDKDDDIQAERPQKPVKETRDEREQRLEREKITSEELATKKTGQHHLGSFLLPFIAPREFLLLPLSTPTTPYPLYVLPRRPARRLGAKTTRGYRRASNATRILTPSPQPFNSHERRAIPINSHHRGSNKDKYVGSA